MSLTENLLRFRLSLQLALVALVVCIAAFGLHAWEFSQLRAAFELRYRSLLLVQELRQSSDDLTRMVRTYVATGDSRYRDQFNEIAAIRDGNSPRPQEYENVYWDLVLDERRPTPMGEPSALLQRMAAAGFTPEELNRLNVAKANSDILIALEQKAMQQVENHASDTSRDLDATRQTALASLYDAAYHRTKADIMRPIAEVIHMVDERTLGEVQASEQLALAMLVVFLLACTWLLAMLCWIQHNLRLVMGGSVNQLSRVVVNAANNETDKELVGNSDPDTIIGKLLKVQENSISAEGQRKDSERALSESERRFRAMAASLNEGVCVVQDALIRFVNHKMTDILQLSEPELIDQPFIQHLDAEDRAALMERYRRRVEGDDIEATSLMNLSSGRRIMTRATQFEWASRPATLYFINVVEEPPNAG